ncbi:hypothetical protein [Corynebacterium sp. HS2168-gen11]|uniref:hypothetical protein n=1 Tax=Corynebacterium sp. HS2168-gen11 TaxID=2974027 RepID=UPI00216B5C82|nr:hypothetical protein [Corynebacterium sp. HS2168-gen11]MCS4536013.1 hypothetical protein [Corynebacterium sp. HS2168-gen11]
MSGRRAAQVVAVRALGRRDTSVRPSRYRIARASGRRAARIPQVEAILGLEWQP